MALIIFCISFLSIMPLWSMSYSLKAMLIFFSTSPVIVNEIENMRSLNWILPESVVSKVLKMALQYFLELPFGNRKLYSSRNFCLFILPDGQSFFKLVLPSFTKQICLLKYLKKKELSYQETIVPINYFVSRKWCVI